MTKSDTGTFHDLKQLRAAFRDVGAQRILVKPLSPNDNSKNQIYIGGDFQSVNLIPHGELEFTTTKMGRIAKAPFNLSWLNPEGKLFRAPDAQIILYPQYPEIRLSGFLQGCKNAPSELLRSRDKGRVLFLGITADSKCVGYVSGPDSPVTREFMKTAGAPTHTVFHEILLTSTEEDNFASLLKVLRTIHKRGWIESWRLDGKGRRCPCNSSNCGGFTLEAELGVRPNSVSGPDFLGWEIKQHGFTNWERPTAGSPVTLMTPEPDGGYYVDEGVEQFIRRFGYKDKMNREDRMNFGGTFIVGKTEKNTNLNLELTGFKAGSRGIDPRGALRIVNNKGVVASSWSNESLIKLWSRKHNRAAYIPSECRKNGVRCYRFGSNISLGNGTSATLLLDAIAVGKMYIDPGIKLEEASSSKPKVKRRSQFRVKWGNLSALYDNWSTIDIMST